MSNAAEYVAFVKNQPCCGCGVAGELTYEQRVDPHHYMEGEGGMGLKVSDWWTVPLCRACHDYFHDHRKLPCYADLEHEIAVCESRAQIYRTQARLLGYWMDIF